jgi:hypothetical protein
LEVALVFLYKRVDKTGENVYNACKVYDGFQGYPECSLCNIMKVMLCALKMHQTDEASNR